MKKASQPGRRQRNNGRDTEVYEGIPCKRLPNRDEYRDQKRPYIYATKGQEI